MKKKLQGFKEFISKGSVFDIAVGVIIAGAFAKIVASLVNDVIMPFIGLIAGNFNLSAWKIVFRQADEAAGLQELSMNIGLFLQTVVDFLLIALLLYLLIRLMQSFKRKKQEEAPAPPPVSKEAELLAEIRDLLKK